MTTAASGVGDMAQAFGHLASEKTATTSWQKGHRTAHSDFSFGRGVTGPWEILLF